MASNPVGLVSAALKILPESRSLAPRARAEREAVFVMDSRDLLTFEWLRPQPQLTAMLKQLDEPPKTEP